MSDETLQLLQKAKLQPFNCRFVSLMHVHNYLMFLRDKSVPAIKDPSQLVFLDIRGTKSSEYFDNVRIFKSEWFDINNFEYKLENRAASPENEEYLAQQMKLYVSMKYLFVIGEQSDFDSSSFRVFLQYIISMDGGKPFQMFLYKFNSDILKIEYPYLCLEGDQKKFLALYPNIVLKCKDLG